ncbi:MAG: PAS domain S-box protein, partial [Flavobacteriaceae bacterium]|nr:PAS domain S-box protein [Flavobacteriaceae bacterium]
MSEADVQLLRKALERQKKARFQAERILEEKSKQLYDVSRHLHSVNDRLEYMLNEKASELDGVFINIIDPYVIMDLEFNVINMNASAKEFLGFDHMVTPINLSELVHKDYVEYTAKSVASLFEVGTLKNYRAKIRVGDGTEKIVEVNGSLIYDKERNPIAAQGIIRDITREAETRELLAQQRKELQIIVENSPLGIVLTDQGMIIKTNPRFGQMLGYGAGELIGRHVKEISAPGDINNSINLLEKMNSGNIDNFTIIKKYLRKDGSELLTKTSVSAFKNRKGEVEYQVAMVEDITEQRNLELQKEKLLGELEARNEGLKEYAHIVSHDLKSPLRSISALATWLGEDYKDVLNEDGLNNLQMMQEKIEAMDTLIDGILKYSSIDLASLENSKIDLNEIVND